MGRDGSPRVSPHGTAPERPQRRLARKRLRRPASGRRAGCAALALLPAHGPRRAVRACHGRDPGDIVFRLLRHQRVPRGQKWASSWLRPFAAKRALRLLPALVVCVWLLALVLGPITTTLSVGDYVTTPQTWIYPLRSSVLMTFAGRLPGVFEHNPFVGAVDGSLWTLPLEACCYVMVAVLGRPGAAAPPCAPRRRRPGGSRGALAAGGHRLASTERRPEHRRWRQCRDRHPLGRPVPRRLAPIRGADRVRLSWWVAGALGVLWVVSWKSSWVVVTASLFVPYAILVIAYRVPWASTPWSAPATSPTASMSTRFPSSRPSPWLEGRRAAGHARHRCADHLPAGPHLVATGRVALPRPQRPCRGERRDHGRGP